MLSIALFCLNGLSFLLLLPNQATGSADNDSSSANTAAAAVNGRDSLKSVRRKVATACSAVAELYMTDLWFVTLHP